MNKSIINSLLGAFFLSILLISCSGGSSSNSNSSTQSIVNSGEGSTVTTADGVEIRVNSDGVPSTG